jgi:ribose-phosphate pyrophosphokinase
MFVAGGSASGGVAEDLAKELGAVAAEVETRRFPDGEAYVRVRGDVAGETVVAVQRLADDADLVELLLLLDALDRRDPEGVAVALPYLPYARQDRVFEEGEALSVAVVAEVVGRRAEAVAVVDPHEASALDRFPCPARSTSALPEVAASLGDEGVDVVLAPDGGARPMAEEAAERLGARADHLVKERVSDDTVRVEPRELDVDGDVVAVVDDIVSTGGTMSEAVATLQDQGAQRVLAACTHGLFADGALDRLRAAGCDRVVTTDSLPNPVDDVPVAPALARGLDASL